MRCGLNLPVVLVVKFARYGPGNFPDGGFCVSSFAIIRRGREILLGKPLRHPRWMQEWAPNWAAYPADRLEREFETWRFPSAYLMEGEHPHNALTRVLRDELEVKKYSLTPPDVYSFYEPSSLRPGTLHWDLCFVSEVKVEEEIRKPEWFAELSYRNTEKMKREEFGSAQGDLGVRLELIAQ